MIDCVLAVRRHCETLRPRTERRTVRRGNVSGIDLQRVSTARKRGDRKRSGIRVVDRHAGCVRSSVYDQVGGLHGGGIHCRVEMNRHRQVGPGRSNLGARNKETRFGQQTITEVGCCCISIRRVKANTLLQLCMDERSTERAAIDALLVRGRG